MAIIQQIIQKNNQAQQQAPQIIVKEALEKVVITLTGRDTIFKLKAFLASNPAPLSDNIKSTTVLLKINERLVELGKNYYLDAKDIARLEKINGVKIVG